jgi:serine/threonine protein kinase
MAMATYGKWETIEELGRGGQGVVYLAKDTMRVESKEKALENIKIAVQHIASIQTQETQKRFAELLAETIAELRPSSPDPSTCGALKVLYQPSEGKAEFEKAKERMGHEVTALRKITHANILAILDENLQSGWFVGEYHPEGPISRHPLLYKGNILAALEAIRPVVEGVALLHESKIVHRDIKPGNVFVAKDGRLVLGDLGLVLFTDATHTRVTDSYENVGSRDWMPAWAMGMRLEDVRPSFDVFSLGKLFWAMVSGRPFLRLWYHHDDDFELEKMFPKDESIRWARHILDKCIVEKEKDCLQTGGDLLSVIDAVLAAVKRHAQVIGEGITRTCQVCGIGTYNCIINENVIDLHNFGLSPAGTQTFKVFSCSNCGHIQLFHFPQPGPLRPRAWSR